MDLNNLFSQFSISGSKDLVYLSVTPGVGLELILLDVPTKTVQSYGYKPLVYKESLREIQDIEAFRTAVNDLFNELKISIKCNIILNVPMVLFGSKQLPILLGDDAIDEALVSEVEQSYIFKRYEPQVAWIDVSNAEQSGDMRKLYYTAIQKVALDDIKNVLSDLGANLVGVQMSLTSLLKGLAFTGLIEEQIQDGVTWNLMIINQNGYSLCSMVGKNIVDYYEEPLAIKSFENDEIYNAINASAQITLLSYPANYLVIVSETDLVSAEVLAAKLRTDGVVKYYENNDFKKQDLIPVSLEVLEESAHRISLEAIGIASGDTIDFPVKFDFIGRGSDLKDNPNEFINIQLGNFSINTSPNLARNYAIAVAVVVLVPLLFLLLALPMVVKSKQAKLSEITAKYDSIEQEVSVIEAQQSKYQDFNVNGEIKKVLSSNRAKLMSYTALGDAVPKKLWLTYFVAQDDGLFDIKGEATNVEDVYAFYKNMKDSLINTKLRLSNLEMKSDTDTAVNSNLPVDYEFEITNMKNVPAADVPQEAEPNQGQQNNGANDNGNVLNKPLLNFNN